jgi:hypothetical protein
MDDEDIFDRLMTRADFNRRRGQVSRIFIEAAAEIDRLRTRLATAEADADRLVAFLPYHSMWLVNGKLERLHPNCSSSCPACSAEQVVRLHDEAVAVR